MAFILNNFLGIRLKKPRQKTNWDEYEDYNPKWLDNIAEKKRGPGRPKGSKNKVKL